MNRKTLHVMPGKMCCLRNYIATLGRITFTVVMLLSVTGCSILGAKAYKDYSIAKLDLGEEGAKTYKKFITEIKEEHKISPACLGEKSSPEFKENACMLQRQTLVTSLLWISDDMCMKHLRSIYGNEAAWNIISGTLTSGFATAATVVGRESAKAGLGALAAFWSAERALVNETVYKSATVAAVVTKINEMRSKKRSLIQEMNTKPYLEYTLPIALADIAQYHNICSFMHGLNKALLEGIQDTTEADIAKLTRRLNMVSLQIAQKTVAIQSGGEEPEESDEIKKLRERYNAISNALQRLEIQVMGGDSALAENIDQNVRRTKTPVTNGSPVVGENKEMIKNNTSATTSGEPGTESADAPDETASEKSNAPPLE